MHVRGLREDNEPIPVAHAIAEYVAVDSRGRFIILLFRALFPFSSAACRLWNISFRRELFLAVLPAYAISYKSPKTRAV